ncbi:MAG: heme biosynthesis HemY N-terminal domain-containing protein [Alphaproteobacteria bacterium]|nr:heme biosynthesis HemY N-terminal domain-containing protein [Alphaproteobacteria bacterium]
MIALFALLLIVAAVGWGASWLGENPGAVTMTWFDYRIDTSIAVLLLAAILAAIFLAATYLLLQKLMQAPKRYSERRSLKHYRLALTEVTRSVAALAASDIASATRHTRRAEKALGTTPLTLLLRAQISKSDGSDAETRQLLEQLLEYPETEYLAAKSLADAAQKQQMLPQAMNFAERAHKINPKEAHGAWAVFDLLIAGGQFQEAETHARHARKTGAFSRADLQTAQGKIACKQAEHATANGNKANALSFARRAIEYLPGDAAVAELCAELYIDNQQPAKALSIIQRQWKIAPSKKLAELFKDVTEEEKPARKEKLVAKLVASNGAAAENMLLE